MKNISKLWKSHKYAINNYHVVKIENRIQEYEQEYVEHEYNSLNMMIDMLSQQI